MKIFVLGLSFGWLVSFTQTFALKRTHPVETLSASFPLRGTSLTSVEDEPMKLFPGRRTPRFFSFLFDDTISLLNPKTMGKYQIKRQEEYGPIFKTNIFFTPTVFVTDEANLVSANLEEAKKAMAPAFPPHHQSLFGKQSIMVSSGDRHSRLRRLIQPCMSPTAVSSYETVIDDSISSFLSDLKQTHTKNFQPIVPKVRAFFISLALEVLLGSVSLDEEDLAEDLTTWSKGLLAAPISFIPWSTAAKAMRARKRITSKLETLIKKEREVPSSGLLAKLATSKDPENGDLLSNEDIIDNVLTLVFAGSDTTASSVISLWLTLSLYPAIKEELKNVDDQVMDNFLQNVLMSHPPAPFAMRQVQEDIVVGEYIIPKGWQLAYGFYGVLQGSSEGKVSDWLSIAKSDSVTSGSRAFGGGARMCPGRFLASRELLSFCKILIKLDWTLAPGQNLEQRYTPGYFPVDGLSIRVKAA